MSHALVARAGDIVVGRTPKRLEKKGGKAAGVYQEVLNASKEAAGQSWPLRTAIVSISNRDNLETLVRIFERFAVHVIATTGTHASLSEIARDKHSSFKLTEVTKYTGYPHNLNGRLKTLHPKVQAGVLGIRKFHDHVMKDKDVDAEYIDLVVANLYPFDETIKRGADFFECVENIDIGGPALIRAGAKNHACVTVIVDPTDYRALETELIQSEGRISPEFRRKMAYKAFSLTANYDTHIANWFKTQLR